jgi:TonB family protein
MGQVVPQPVKMPLPAKPAPVQHEVRGEETWKVKNQKDTKVPPKPTSTDETVERGETPQKAQSNVIRLGTSEGAKAGEGNYDYGAGPGVGPGIGIGFGPGEGGGGFGFGSYLRLLRERIWSEWTQSAVIGSKLSCVVGLTVAMNGDTSNIKLEKSSGNSFYDNVAMRAVRNASPLPPLPPNFPRSSQRFNLQFRLQD